MFAALRRRDFRLLFAGQSLSIVGDGAYTITLSWFTYDLTRSAGSVALVLGVVTAAKLASLLFGGVIADRGNKRRLMLGIDGARGLVMGAVAAMTLTHQITLTVLVLFAAVVGLLDSLFGPCFSGLVPSLVPPGELASANGLVGFIRSAGVVAGPVIGGALYAALGPGIVFALDAGTFFWAAALISLARTAGARPSRPGTSPLQDAVEGARYVRTTPLLMWSIPIAALAMMLSDAPTQTLLPRLVSERFPGGALTLGAFETTLGIGYALGALLCARKAVARRRAVVVFAGWAAGHVLCAVLALQSDTIAALSLSVARGFAAGYASVLWETLLMSLVPKDKLARVFSLDSFGASGMLPVGFVLAGLLAPLAPAGTIIAWGQLTAGALMLSLLLVRSIRTVDHREAL
ncbi:MFS transporter [Amycolatopsis sp. PS_44_ISF1]|uniref:MFS transporter n=1 Tax=Amycolatopsis sp. PS_44_ISF1 TaxID=2974917 RepID=UPI0028E040FA|nr:MFS transporter [Amycolatopsis sp. PS_44_ISF1]MDT8911795.1 MFS transporter [Amycolatopsis sp. PS_44_ISF1]